MLISLRKLLIASCIAVVVVVALLVFTQHLGFPAGTRGSGSVSSTSLSGSVATSTSGESVSGEPTSLTPLTVGSPRYDLAVETLKEILKEAKPYLHGVRRNESWGSSVPPSELDTALILNSTIVNETTLRVGNATYKYVIVQAWDNERHVRVEPEEIKVSNVIIERVPENKSVTTTGGTVYDYLIRVGNRVCRARFYYIGFQVATGNLTSLSYRICGNIYEVSIIVNPGKGLRADKGVYLVLLKEGRSS